MSISQYQAFLKTIELGNLTRAAEDLGYTQSGITHLLNSLESDCNLKLLVREKSGAYATADGEELMPYFEEICQSYDNLYRKLNDIHRLESGLIRISTFTSVSVQWLPSIIAKFEKDYPLVRFELLHGSDIESEDWVRSGRVDCAFMSLSEETPFVTYPLHKDPMVAVVPADHPLAVEEKIAIDDLVKYDYIKLNDSSFSDVSEIAEVFNKHKVKPNVRFAEMNDYAVVAMVEKGLGVTLLPQMIVEKTSRNIAIRPLVSGEQRTLGIAVKNQNHLTASTKEFIKYTQEWVSEKYPKEEL